jgi:hypothetical protein
MGTPHCAPQDQSGDVLRHRLLYPSFNSTRIEPAGYADDVLDKLGWRSADFVNRDYMDSGREETDVSEPETILEEASAKLGD